MDGFDLETKVGLTGDKNMSVDEHIRDHSLFQEIVKHLSNNRAPGPDEINNELLKHLPPSMHQAIHKLFVLMWLTGTTPDSWKESNTILLHKNSESLLENYRPIALASTMYKLWTSLIQESLGRYAEYYDILSTSQEGFRHGRGTMRQLHNLMNVLSDAKVLEQNLYMLYVDFSAAFNTIDHDRLLQIMYDLGFPTNAIQVIANLYTNATTCVKLPGGKTQPILINRGTIQGDSLSPLLFLIFIEPMLRWLHSGGRGYSYGCLQNTPDAELKTSSMAYADNLLAVTSAAKWLTLQAHKIESFMRWAGMSVNCKKCGVTGMLYAKTTMVSKVLGADAIKLLQSRLSHVKFKGESVPFLHPDTEPYTYLGVDITPTMNWAFQVDKVMREMRENGERLEDSMLRRTQKLYFIKIVIVTKASCIFPLGYLRPTDLAKLDSIYSRICKKSVGIPSSSPTALVFEDRSKAGIGMPSLQVDYTQSITEALVYALHDSGHLGIISRALLYLQNSIVGNLIQDQRAKATLRQVTHYHLAKKLATIQEAGLKFTTPKGNSDLVGNLLCEQLTGLRFDLTGGGYVHEVPVSMCLPLLELGYSSFADLLTKDKSPAVISTAELKKRHAGIGRRHTLALNKLTVLVNEVELDRQAIDEAQGYTKVGAMEHEQRKVRNPAFTELCTRTTEHTGAAALHTQERSALQMLRSHQMADSLDAFIEKVMHEGEDADLPDGIIAKAIEEQQWAQRDAEGRLFH